MQAGLGSMYNVDQYLFGTVGCAGHFHPSFSDLLQLCPPQYSLYLLHLVPIWFQELVSPYLERRLEMSDSHALKYIVR